MAGLKQGDAVLMRSCGQVGEVLCADLAGHVLLRLPLLDAVVLVRESSVRPLEGEARKAMDLAMLEQRRQASQYLETLMRTPSRAA